MKKKTLPNPNPKKKFIIKTKFMASETLKTRVCRQG